MRPQSVHRLAPQDAQALARLLQNYGEAATEQLLAPAAQTSPAEARQRQGDLRAYRLLQAQIQRELWRRAARLRRATAASAVRHYPADLQGQIGQALQQVRADNPAIPGLAPAHLVRILTQQITMMVLLHSAAQRAGMTIQQAADARLTPQEQEILGADARDRSRLMRSLNGRERRHMQRLLRVQRSRQTAIAILQQIHTLPDPLLPLHIQAVATLLPATHAYQHAQREPLVRLVRTGGFRQWLRLVKERPIYDQSAVMVEALDDVRSHPSEGTHFYGGHHWTVASRTILETPQAYGDMVLQDMRRRSIEQLERILCNMAESAGGRRILFGEGDRAADAYFLETLQQRLAEESTTREEILERVRQRVVSPYEGVTGTSGQLLRELRDRGYFLDA